MMVILKAGLLEIMVDPIRTLPRPHRGHGRLKGQEQPPLEPKNPIFLGEIME